MKVCQNCNEKIPTTRGATAVYCSAKCIDMNRRARQLETAAAARAALATRRAATAADAARRVRERAEYRTANIKPVLPKQRPNAPFYRAASLAMTPEIHDETATRGDVLTGAAASVSYAANVGLVSVSI